MKTKLLFLLIASMFAIDAFAGKTILIVGGTRDNKFHYVRITDKSVTCKYNGNNPCPITYVHARSKSGKEYLLDNIVTAVNERIKSGEREGSFEYENDMPVNWTSNDNTLEINIDDDDNYSFEPYKASDEK